MAQWLTKEGDAEGEQSADEENPCLPERAAETVPEAPELRKGSGVSLSTGLWITLGLGMLAMSGLAAFMISRRDTETLKLGSTSDVPHAKPQAPDISPSMLSAQEMPGCQTRDVLQKVIQEPCRPFTDSDPRPRVLVTGGAGFVGGHLIKALRREGVRSVKLVDNLWRGRLSNLCDLGCHCEVDMESDFCFADLTNTAEFGPIFEGADLVYHLADVVAGIGFVFSHQQWLFRQNVLINVNVMQAVLQSSTVKDYIYVGTACSFPLELQSSYDFIALRENQTFPAHPESAYGWSKLMGEYEGNLVAESPGQDGRRVNVGILRFHNLYGPRSTYADTESSQALPALIRKAINSPMLETYEMWGSGRQYRDFLYVDDAVSGLLAMHTYGMNKGVIQIGTGVPTTLLEAARMIAELTKACLGKDLDLKVNNTRREGDMGRVGQLDRAKTILQWRAKVSTREGLARMYAWIISDMRSHGNTKDWMFANGTSADSVEKCLGAEATTAAAQTEDHGPPVRVPDGLKVWR